MADEDNRDGLFPEGESDAEGKGSRFSFHLIRVTSVHAMASKFEFQAAKWQELCEPAQQAETLAMSEAWAACLYARRALELAMH